MYRYIAYGMADKKTSVMHDWWIPIPIRYMYWWRRTDVLLLNTCITYYMCIACPGFVYRNASTIWLLAEWCVWISLGIHHRVPCAGRAQIALLLLSCQRKLTYICYFRATQCFWETSLFGFTAISLCRFSVQPYAWGIISITSCNGMEMNGTSCGGILRK